MMLTLGEFVFWALGTSYDAIERDTKWRVATHKRVGQRPLLQFVGPDDDLITIPGTLYPQLTSGAESIEQLRALGDAGESLPLVDEAGWVYGLWAISQVRETQRHIMGGKAQRIDFTVSLVRDDDSAIAQRVYTFA
jgi:phage protein U